MQITNEWTEVTLSAVNTYTTVQNISGEVILLALDTDVPTSEEANAARRVDFFKSGEERDDVYTYDHSVDTRKLYVRMLNGKKTGHISVY